MNTPTKDRKDSGEGKPTSPNPPAEGNQEGQPGPQKPSAPEGGSSSDVDYWKGVATQTQEKLGKANVTVKTLKAQIEEQSKIEIRPDNIEQELRRERSDWEDLDEAERKRLISEKLEKARTNVRIAQQDKEIQDLKWENSFDRVISNPDYSQLKEREAEFREFAEQPDNKGLNLDTLAKSFLFEDAKRIGAEEEVEKAKRSALERPSGGEKTAIKPSEMSLKELKRMRKDDPRRYERLIEQGKITKVPEK
ncbi:hypothetical protein MYX07_00355 [Patescibacteria group bacterium AH-259-L07]|nr:hypothetical protein [Patescibacteria group bacterium AH-259-L07]